ncbi:kinesin-like protein KIF19 [Oncorhynchus nerka]|uniref:kinesin-like protein KIF19 n=1 Tax=Oncorhynchus nerka TaxID=8023 RepID=UPI0031B7F13B
MNPMEDPDNILRANRSREKTYMFDVAFDCSANQEEVYRATTKGLIEGLISGYNATVFAYGPTGCGKTFTMLGTDREPGIYVHTLNDLFKAIEETSDDMQYNIFMSYLEIYNEMIRDLLNPSSGFLDLREDSKGEIQVAGITEVCTINAREIMDLLMKGNKQRTQEPTAANQTSSRSHAVLQVSVRQTSRCRDLLQEVRFARLFMIDLAGSERASQTQNRGQRLKEGAHINRSLLALGNCINALSEKHGNKYVNYRDSKLTRLLKDSLGGNSRTVMIAHISPASLAFEESRNTLSYADRAKSIRTRKDCDPTWGILTKKDCDPTWGTLTKKDTRPGIPHQEGLTVSRPGESSPRRTDPTWGTLLTKKDCDPTWGTLTKKDCDPTWRTLKKDCDPTWEPSPRM